MRALVPACPPVASRSSTMTSRPSEAAYTAAASPDGPAPTTIRSCTSAGSNAMSRPAHLARPSMDGRRWNLPSRPITTGVSDAGMPNWRRSASACGSPSRSIQVNGIALRVAKSRRLCACEEKREPMILTPSKPSLSSSERRIRKALMMTSPRSGSSSTASRSIDGLSSSTSPSSATRPVTSAARPVSMSTSPENCCAWCTTTERGRPRELSRMSIGAGDHDEEAVAAVPFGEQHVAGLHRATAAAGLQGRDLRARQYGNAMSRSLTTTASP